MDIQFENIILNYNKAIIDRLAQGMKPTNISGLYFCIFVLWFLWAKTENDCGISSFHFFITFRHKIDGNNCIYEYTKFIVHKPPTTACTNGALNISCRCGIWIDDAYRYLPDMFIYLTYNLWINNIWIDEMANGSRSWNRGMPSKHIL